MNSNNVRAIVNVVFDTLDLLKVEPYNVTMTTSSVGLSLVAQANARSRTGIVVGITVSANMPLKHK